jgi:hypothetical protein
VHRNDSVSYGASQEPIHKSPVKHIKFNHRDSSILTEAIDGSKFTT